VRIDPQLLAPVKHRSAQAQADLCIKGPGNNGIAARVYSLIREA
jgi:hypothetical protein